MYAVEFMFAPAIIRLDRYYRTTVPREVRKISKSKENYKNEQILIRIIRKGGREMTKHAILLAERKWCEAASSGRIKVYDFRKPRKRGIYALGPGSVCVIATKPRAGEPSIVYGEFTVIEVEEVDTHEYYRLAGEGLIHDPQILSPSEKRWIIRFDEFREYRRKIPKNKLTDVKTSTSKKPISEWIITGLSYIDEQALEAIRRKAKGFVEKKTIQSTPSFDERIRKLEEKLAFIEKLLGTSDLPFPITHECAELMLLKIGRQLGFNVYSADPSKSCSSTKLGDLTDMSRDDLSRFVGPEILDSLSRIDVVWYKQGTAFYAFEVVIGGNMHEALLRLSRIGELNTKLFIVSNENMKNEYKKVSKTLLSSLSDANVGLYPWAVLLKYMF